MVLLEISPAIMEILTYVFGVIGGGGGILAVAKIIHMFRDDIGYFLKLKRKKGKSEEDKYKIDLYKHKIYLEKSFIIHKINTIDVGDNKKNRIFRSLLLIKYDSVLTKSSELIDKTKGLEYDYDDFYRMILKNMTSIIDDYQQKIKNEFGGEIYGLIMDHPEKGFNRIHEKTISYIKGISDSTFNRDHIVYKTTEDKLEFLLDLYHMAMKSAMSDVGSIYSDFNGDLTKLIKKNKNL